ncbi:MAG: hypothetical protein DWQ04_03275, partial [Chloroflexi bacterium]
YILTVPVAVASIEIEIQALGIGPIEFSPFVAVGMMALVALVAIVLGGAVISFINSLISRQVTAVIDDETFKEKQSQLVQRDKDLLKQMKEGRTPSTPNHNRPGWSAVSTSLIVLFFVWIGGMVINGTIYPEGQLISDAGEVVNSAPRVIVPLVLFALLILSFRMRPGKVVAAESADAAPIPWDAIAVILLGLLVVGLGLAAMMLLL